MHISEHQQPVLLSEERFCSEKEGMFTNERAVRALMKDIIKFDMNLLVACCQPWKDSAAACEK